MLFRAAQTRLAAEPGLGSQVCLPSHQPVLQPPRWRCRSEPPPPGSPARWVHSSGQTAPGLGRGQTAPPVEILIPPSGMGNPQPRPHKTDRNCYNTPSNSFLLQMMSWLNSLEWVILPLCPPSKSPKVSSRGSKTCTSHEHPIPAVSLTPSVFWVLVKSKERQVYVMKVPQKSLVVIN